MEENNNSNSARVIAIIHCPECNEKLIPAETTSKEPVGVCPKGCGIFGRYQRATIVDNEKL